MVPKVDQATIVGSEENDEGLGIGCIISFFGAMGKMGSTVAWTWWEMHTGRSSG
jgi:hypothetical protein